MGEELTYILGTGASFQSIPVVKTFPARFMKFSNFIVSLQNDYQRALDYDSKVYNNITKLKEWSQSLQKVFKSHQSFDTYFKKLFHTVIQSVQKRKYNIECCPEFTTQDFAFENN